MSGLNRKSRQSLANLKEIRALKTVFKNPINCSAFSQIPEQKLSPKNWKESSKLNFLRHLANHSDT